MAAPDESEARRLADWIMARGVALAGVPAYELASAIARGYVAEVTPQGLDALRHGAGESLRALAREGRTTRTTIV